MYSFDKEKKKLFHKYTKKMGNLGHIIKLNGEKAFRVAHYKYKKR